MADQMADNGRNESAAGRLTRPRKGKAGIITVVISGPSRSGKSRLAQALVESLLENMYVAAVAVEGQERHWTRTCMRDGNESEEEPQCTDWTSFVGAVTASRAKLLASLGGPAKATKHRQAGSSVWTAGQWANTTTSVSTEKLPKVAILIVEGFNVLHDYRLASAADHIFHLDLPKSEMMNRRAAKPSKEKPNPNPKCRRYCEQVVWPAHIDYMDASVSTTEGVMYLDMMKQQPFKDIVESVVTHIVGGQPPKKKPCNTSSSMGTCTASKDGHGAEATAEIRGVGGSGSGSSRDNGGGSAGAGTAVPATSAVPAVPAAAAAAAAPLKVLFASEIGEDATPPTSLGETRERSDGFLVDVEVRDVRLTYTSRNGVFVKQTVQEGEVVWKARQGKGTYFRNLEEFRRFIRMHYHGNAAMELFVKEHTRAFQTGAYFAHDMLHYIANTRGEIYSSAGVRTTPNVTFDSTLHVVRAVACIAQGEEMVVDYTDWGTPPGLGWWKEVESTVPNWVNAYIDRDATDPN